LRKTNTALASTTLVTWNERVIPEALAGRVVRFYGGSAEKPPQYQFCAPSSSVMVIVGLDNSVKILSSDYDLIFVDEAVELTEDDWEVLKTRLRNGRMPYQQIIGATNPSRTEHWLNRRADSGLMTRLYSRHVDNPVYFDDAGQPIVSYHDGAGGVVFARHNAAGWDVQTIFPGLGVTGPTSLAHIPGTTGIACVSSSTRSTSCSICRTWTTTRSARG